MWCERKAGFGGGGGQGGEQLCMAMRQSRENAFHCYSAHPKGPWTRYQKEHRAMSSFANAATGRLLIAVL